MQADWKIFYYYYFNCTFHCNFV